MSQQTLVVSRVAAGLVLLGPSMLFASAGVYPNVWVGLGVGTTQTSVAVARVPSLYRVSALRERGPAAERPVKLDDSALHFQDLSPERGSSQKMELAQHISERFKIKLSLAQRITASAF